MQNSTRDPLVADPLPKNWNSQYTPESIRISANLSLVQERVEEFVAVYGRALAKGAQIRPSRGLTDPATWTFNGQIGDVAEVEQRPAFKTGTYFVGSSAAFDNLQHDARYRRLPKSRSSRPSSLWYVVQLRRDDDLPPRVCRFD
jgi:hypothetical protein